ncbi:MULTISPECIES: DJ-1/PfpI family protein [Bacillaceae]|jgi:protease I|uniref:Peptidase n=1 Tax=Aeribacillus pallidus TaxID=33936 RepID=A0A165Z7L3_9BACI|nr:MULTISPECIES: DJ-1/PfpI family protein [Bacillaceae]ASS90641.1 peptidase [Aeribacillus pallidus]KZM54628.1 peptidase [Aeribacillus pallidus]KZN97939.1 peptidase [Aeribacillus pallidus]MCM3799660.1 DJ-1/PfpI family protein [Caldibacillus thermoamylovorans]MDR9792046.1 DJ-1/PfpI family protein [Aeribacillus pallidus]
MSKNVLIITGDAAEALEVFYPYYRCIEENINCTIASPVKKKLQTVVHDFLPEMETFTEKWAYKIESHASVDEINPADYDGLIIPGGRAPEYIRMNPKVQEIAAHFLKENKPLGVICHGQLVLTTVREYIKGREMTAYTACRPEVEAAGATYVEKMLHVDGNIVSGHAWPDLPGFMREFFKLLNVREKSAV